MSPEVRPGTPVPDRSPRKIGPYLVRARIGRGAMGVVYRAVDERTEAVVALKAVASDLDSDPETRERFFREAHVAGRLRHRNIVTVLDSGEDGSRLYIAMELLSGATLNEEIKNSAALDIEDLIDLMIQICQGLQVAHAAGVYHRDLKPANLFVCDDRRVKILDFGVARLVGSNMTLTGNIIGTPDFMSPEQVRGRDVDERSDIFSAGSVFYLLLTGKKPFAAPDLPAVLNKVVRAQPLPIREDEAPEPIAAVVRKAMAKDPDARQQSVVQLASELMAASAAIELVTRKTAAEVRRMADEVIRFTRRRTELSAMLAVPDGPNGWSGLGERFPILRRGPAVLDRFPLRSRVVMSLEEAVRAVLEQLTPVVTTLEMGNAALVEGQRLQADGKLEEASASFSAALRAVPSSPVILGAIAACTKAIEDRAEREARLQTRLALAGEAGGRADWTALLAIVKDIEDLDPGNPQAAPLRAQAAKGLEADQARVARERGRRPAASVSPRSSRPAEGAPVSAGTRLPAPAVAVSLEEPGASVDRTSAARLAQAARLNEEAARYFSAGDLVAAERTASQSVSLNGENHEARHLLERVRTAIILHGQKDDRWRRITELLRRANTFADRHHYDKALALVDEALLIDSSQENATAMRARLVEEHATYEAEQAAAAAKQRRARTAAPALQQAQRAFNDGDLARARWCAENALALAPDSAEALALMAQIAAATPPPSDDETVDLEAPEDETVELAPLRPTLQDRMIGLRGRASAWMRRLGRSDDESEDR